MLDWNDSIPAPKEAIEEKGANIRNLFITCVVALLACSNSLVPRALADPPLSILKGDGLVVRVLTLSNDGTMVAGELTRGDGTHAFTGRISSDGDVEIVRGSFRVGQKTFEFSSSQPEGEDLVN